MHKDSSKSLKIESYIVPELSEKSRIQDLASGMFVHTPTKSGLKKAIRKGLVEINGVQVSSGTFLLGGETINLFQRQDSSTKPKIELKLEVVFEDEFLALVNKPPGITVSGIKKWTLENALSSNLKISNQTDALIRPEPIHRLDHATSGILLVGKTASSVIFLNKLFENREIQKTYYAVVIGNIKSTGSITKLVDGKTAATDYTVIHQEVSKRFNMLSLVKLTPSSGRKHQLRKHLASQGNPILGDPLYGTQDKLLKGNGLYLHAYSLNFKHPFTKEIIHLSIPPTKKFLRLFSSIKF